MEPEGYEPEELEPGIVDGFALGIVDEDGLQRLDEDAALQTNEYRLTPNS